MPQIPKKIEKLLQRRRDLAEQLICVGVELDNYCEKIGIAPAYDGACLGTHFMIYTDPGSAYLHTKEAIEKALDV